MSYEVPIAPGESPTEIEYGTHAGGGWQLWEVFVRPKRGLSYTHCGSIHAPDAESAMLNARDAYTRRGDTSALWVVPSTSIHASSDPTVMFDPSDDKPYRYPTFYEIPDEVGQL